MSVVFIYGWAEQEDGTRRQVRVALSDVQHEDAGGSPGGDNLQIQYNDNGAFGGLVTVYAEGGGGLGTSDPLTLKGASWYTALGPSPYGQGNSPVLLPPSDGTSQIISSDPNPSDIGCTTYTPQLYDSWLRFTSDSAVTVTIPENGDVPFHTGKTFQIEQAGNGTVTLEAVNGNVTLNSRGDRLSTAGKYAVGALTQLAPDVWTVYGDLTT